MAILSNGLETIELGSTTWRIICNSNFEKTVTDQKLQDGVNYDIKIVDNSKGFVVKDRTDGNFYRIYTDNGAIQVEQA